MSLMGRWATQRSLFVSCIRPTHDTELISSTVWVKHALATDSDTFWRGIWGEAASSSKVKRSRFGRVIDDLIPSRWRDADSSTGTRASVDVQNHSLGRAGDSLHVLLTGVGAAILLLAVARAFAHCRWRGKLTQTSQEKDLEVSNQVRFHRS